MTSLLGLKDFISYAFRLEFSVIRWNYFGEGGQDEQEEKQEEKEEQQEQQGSTTTPVACGWAGAVFKSMWVGAVTTKI